MMSRHDGVSCDSCLVGNFRGKRFKCLICYDYDLCATCYEAGATTTRHTTEHPMQCILTRTDFDLYYGGEAISVEQPQAFTCPFCGKMGFTESTLQDHVSSEHTDTSFEVVCPVCAALPGGDPNLVTDDFAAHLTLEHRGSRDIDEPSSSRHVRRIPQPGRGVGATRARRSNMHFSSSGGLASLSPSSRDSMDPIAELLSQLSGVRRVGGGTSQSSTTSQLQQLQMQLQLERQQAQVARQQLERLPRRTAQIASGLGTGSSASGGGGATSNGVGGGSGPGASVAAVTVQPPLVVEPGFSRPNSGSLQFLLSRCVESTLTEAELQQSEIERADRSVFVRELLVNALVEGLNRDTEQNSLVVKASSSSSEEGASAAVGTPSVAHSAFDVEPAVTGGGVSSSASAPNVTSRVGGGTGSSKKGQCGGGGGGSGRGYGARSATSLSREAPPQQQQQLQQPPPQQQQHNSTGNGGTTGRNTQGQQQRVASLGTGTVREMSVPQGVVTQRIPVTRRKFLRQMDGRNQPNEPPPPH